MRGCVATACESIRTKCWGQAWESGVGYYDGACASFIGCEQQCDCNNLSCVGNCSKLTYVVNFGMESCSDCLAELTACEQTCTYPSCRGTWHTCSQLQACCPKLVGDASVECNNIASAGYADDCNAAYPQLSCP